MGGPTCAVIANKCPDIQVTVADLNSQRIASWNTDHLPIYEPGLMEILKPARDGIGRTPNLIFSDKVRESIAAADLIFLCVPTPTKSTGTGSGRAADLVFVEKAARMIAEVATDDKIVVEKSTVPCKTADRIRGTFSAMGRPGVRFDILSNPEFLAEGTAINDLLEPDRILIGSLKTERGLQACAALADVYARWVPRERVITMNIWSAEMAKLAANALLAQRISSINALSAVCEATGADIDEVAYAVGLDRRIGSKMLKSSIGFGGSCFKKDVLNLVYIAETMHLPEVASYWNSVVDINEYQKDRFIKRIVACLFQTLTNKKVAILGYAYKKDTGDTRESAAISIVNHLIVENAEVTIYDPKVEESAVWESLSYGCDNFDKIKERTTVCKNAYEACEEADAVVIATEWDEFSNKSVKPTTTTPSNPTTVSHSMAKRASSSSQDSEPLSSTNGISSKSSLADLSSRTSVADEDETAVKGTAPLVSIREHVATIEEFQSNGRLDWSHVARVMRKPMYVFDGRNVVDAAKLGRLGFRVEGIGKAGTGTL